MPGRWLRQNTFRIVSDTGKQTAGKDLLEDILENLRRRDNEAFIDGRRGSRAVKAWLC